MKVWLDYRQSQMYWNILSGNEQNKSNAWRKKVLESEKFLGKSSLKKLSIKIYGQNPCKTVVKNIIFSFLNTWNSIAFIQKCKYCPHCRNNGLLLIKMKKNRSLFNNNKVSICLLLFFKWISFMVGSIFRIFLATVPPSPRQISVMSWRYYMKKICK